MIGTSTFSSLNAEIHTVYLTYNLHVERITIKSLTISRLYKTFLHASPQEFSVVLSV